MEKTIQDEIFDKIEAKINSIFKETESTLKTINEQAKKHPEYNVNSSYALPEEYYEDVAVYAWGERGKQIALIRIQDFLNNLKKELTNSQAI